jgi:CelD/BcsL family acetyltransferase involved in cellulose biosynthesis
VVELPDYRIESCDVYDPAILEQEWTELQGRSDCSYFQSWGWIGTWLVHVAGDLQPVVIKVYTDTRLVGAGIFVSGTIKRHGFIVSSAMFLNEYPFPGKNMVIEYNGLLAERGHENAVYEAVIRYLLREFSDYDEFHFGAIGDDAGIRQLETGASTGVNIITNEVSTAWRIDLSRLSPGLAAFLARLSKNRRSQIMRSIRAYERNGALRLVEAENAEEALEFMDGLKSLHAKRWEARGKPGAFANPLWERFHRALIEKRFDKGEIQLLRVSNARTNIGYEYNLVWRRQILVMQTGFGISADRRLQPGYVVHAMAVAHNRSKGMVLYDFMHGDSLYKRILCNQSQEMRWVIFQRRRLKFALEKIAVAAVRRYRSLLC